MGRLHPQGHGPGAKSSRRHTRGRLCPFLQPAPCLHPRTGPSVPGQSSPGRPRCPPRTLCQLMVLSHRGSAQGPTLHPHSSVVNGHSADMGWDPAPGHSSPMGKLPGGLCCTPGSTTAPDTGMGPVLGAGSRAAGGHPPPRPSLPCSAPATWAEPGLGAHSTHPAPPPATNRLLPARYLRAKSSHTQDFSIPHGHRGSVQDGHCTAGTTTIHLAPSPGTRSAQSTISCRYVNNSPGNCSVAEILVHANWPIKINNFLPSSSDEDQYSEQEHLSRQRRVRGAPALLPPQGVPRAAPGVPCSWGPRWHHRAWNGAKQAASTGGMGRARPHREAREGRGPSTGAG